mgnify:CR=1 FL=1
MEYLALLGTALKNARVRAQRKATHTHIRNTSGLDNLEQLQTSSNLQVYEETVRLLELYFAAEEEEEVFTIANLNEGNLPQDY